METEPYGLIVDDGFLACPLCVGAWRIDHPNNDPHTYEEVSALGYPDGYTCDVCGDVVAPR